VSTCEFCQPFKSRVGYAAGKLFQLGGGPKEVFEMVAVDHLGPFKKTANGNQHLIVGIDYLTRWIEVKVVKDTGSDSAIVFFVFFVKEITSFFNMDLLGDSSAIGARVFFIGVCGIYERVANPSYFCIRRTSRD
jgi:hypothetical protein